METCKKLKWTDVQHVDVASLVRKSSEIKAQPLEILCLNTVYDPVVPNGVLIFGKVLLENTYKSISLIVNKVWKTVFFKKDLWSFCEELLVRYKEEKVISEYFITECKKKVFANMKTVEVECIKVKFCSHGLAVRNAFSENLYFGYKTDNVENTLLKLGLNGPSWVKVTNFSVNSQHLTNSKLEIVITDLSSIEKIEKIEKSEAPLDIIILAATWNDRELTGIEYSLYKNTEITKFSEHTQPTHTEKLTCPGSFSQEKEMINFFLMKIFVADPDIVLTPKNFLNRFIVKCRNLKVKNWSRIGKIIRKKMPNDQVSKKVGLGRIFYEDGNKETETLGFDQFFEFVVGNRVLEVAWMVAKVTGMDFERSLTGGVLQKVEFLVIKELHKNGYLWPENVQKDDGAQFKFKGGLVLDPKPGLYQNVICLDFTSLYPSIIQEFKICPTGQNLLSHILSSLLQKRNDLTSALQSTQFQSQSQFTLLNLQQKALKSLSNSLYGCFSSKFFRFYMPAVSEKTAYYGRQILLDASNAVSTALALNVIYGDTDSLMIESGLQNDQDVHDLGVFIESMINQNYEVVRIRIETIYSTLFIMQKKNYAGISSDSQKIVVKGLVRGNNSIFFQGFVKDSLEVLLKEGFSEMDNRIIKAVREIEELKEDLFFVENEKSGDFSMKLKNDGKVDWKWYVDKEILPFRNRVKQILSPDNAVFVLCANKHKVYLFQDLQVVLECKECSGSFNISWNYCQNTCKNIATLNMKQKISELYTQPLGSKDRKKAAECNLLERRCVKQTRTCQLTVHFCRFQQFNEFAKDLISVTQAHFSLPSLQGIYRNSSYFKVNLSSYLTRPQYYRIIQRLN